jgi:hypothetical protein
VPPGGTLRSGAQALPHAALALLILALNISPISNNDLFLHLRTGAIILESGAVPTVDDYSALARGRPYIAHEWLTGVVFRVVERAFGLDALIVLRALVALLVAAVLYAAARAQGASAPVALPALALVMVLAAARFMERPHIFTYLFTAVLLCLLARRRAGARAPLLAFLPCQVLWTNLHGGFLLGPSIVALAAAAEALDGLLATLFPAAARVPGAARAHLREAAKLALLAPILLATCLLNPYGARLLRFPFELTGSAFMETVYEWLPPFGSEFASTYMARYYVAWFTCGIAVLVASMVAAVRRRTFTPGGTFPILLFGALFALSLRMNRNVTDFALATFPGITSSATWVMERRGEEAAGRAGGSRPALGVSFGLATVFIALAAWFVMNGYAFSPSSRRPFGLGLGDNIPVSAADYLERNRVRGNVFNTYATGSYLVYRFHPAMRVAMDSRNDVYGEELYREYSQALVDPAAFDALLRKIDAQAIVLEWPKPGVAATAAAVRKLGAWKPVYFDDVTVVYLRSSGPYAPVVERDGYSLLDPPLFLPGDLQPTDAGRALEEADRALRDGRSSYVARIMKIDALLSLGRPREAFEEEGRILEKDPPLYHIYNYLGMMRLASGDRKEAEARFRRALALNPESQVARQGLVRSGGGP